MRVQPRQHLLEVWKALVAMSLDDKGEWVWRGRSDKDTVSDAQQLLCLVFPAVELEGFRLENPDETDQDVLDALQPLGDAVAIPRKVVDIATSYLERHSDPIGDPLFSGGRNFIPIRDGKPADDELPSEAQLLIDVTESFALSVTLTLALLGFVREYRKMASRQALQEKINRLEILASKRLTAALVGLMRSFTVNTFDVSERPGKVLLESMGLTGNPSRREIDDLQRALRGVSNGLRDLTVGSGKDAEVTGPTTLFECGWSWGTISGAPEVDFSASGGAQRVGYASDEPYLYFTTVALDGIADLFTERTRALGLLDPEQQRLAQALQLRWDLTQQYWAVLSSYGGGRWPLENIPWRTTDDLESDYYTALVSAIVVRELIVRAAGEREITRLADILGELANRTRITRRAMDTDPAISLHDGVAVELVGSDKPGGPALAWVARDFAPVLLKRSLALVPFTSRNRRDDLIDLIDDLWGHLERRRLDRRPRSKDGKGLWDEPGRAFDAIPLGERVHWQPTHRVVESLVSGARFVQGDPPPSPDLEETGRILLTEAEHLYDQELFGGGPESGDSMQRALSGIKANLDRARIILGKRPGSAVTLIQDALRELDRLAAARESAERVI
ncbi:hypothetical protein Afil01_06210 [Actinorhabdospora filicis]|uniref:Uncharacterized protein n=1 Tax=Actinorhabdospora filicis TaxID=1785913 RepID=A0A9W6W6R3_9ACTN|nr:SCO2524 family protein [Actinorhabdospora filicis]GLZ75814.1 hypothetical protein Afil01_06210 [Actinorhabdospora filicis]